VPFSKPVSFDGELKLEKTANGIAKTGSELGFRPEVGPRALCECEVEGDCVPTDRSVTFVRLFSEANEAFTPVHVVLTEDSKVELLAAEAEVIWSEDAHEANLKVGKDPWPKVRIDNKEGWIHSEEDFEAIGLSEMD
jgi:hypothetical protein